MEYKDMSFEELLVHLLGKQNTKEDKADMVIFGEGRFIHIHYDGTVWCALLGARNTPVSNKCAIEGTGDTVTEAVCNLIELVREIYLTLI
jgi:hypothetical protein